MENSYTHKVVLSTEDTSGKGSAPSFAALATIFNRLGIGILRYRSGDHTTLDRRYETHRLRGCRHSTAGRSEPGYELGLIGRRVLPLWQELSNG